MLDTILLRDIFWESCKLACIGGQIETGSGLDEDGRRTRPAVWQASSTGFQHYITVKSLDPLRRLPNFANMPPMMRNATVRLGWACIPLSVEEAMQQVYSLHVSPLVLLVPHIQQCLGFMKVKHCPCQGQC